MTSQGALRQQLQIQPYPPVPKLVVMKESWWCFRQRIRLFLSVVVALTHAAATVVSHLSSRDCWENAAFPSCLFFHRSFPSRLVRDLICPGSWKKIPQCVIVLGPQAGLENCYQVEEIKPFWLKPQIIWVVDKLQLFHLSARNHWQKNHELILPGKQWRKVKWRLYLIMP